MEFAFMEFLMTREYDAEIEQASREILPDSVFSSEFTKRFAATWREESLKGEDMFAAFAENLSRYEREWFDKVLLGAGKTEASAMTPIEILHDFARKLWIERLKRERNSIALDASAESDIRRMKISMEIKRFASGAWDDVAKSIKELKGEN